MDSLDEGSSVVVMPSSSAAALYFTLLFALNV